MYGVLEAVLSAVVMAAVSAAVSQAMAPKINTPNASAATKAGVESDIATLPARRAIEAAARMGTRVEIPSGVSQTGYEYTVPKSVWNGLGKAVKSQLRLDSVTPEGDSVRVRGFQNPNGFGPLTGVGTDGAQIPLFTSLDTFKKPEIITADFTGIGDFDTARKVANQLAQAQLDTQKKYGLGFIESAKAQQELADPEGTAARKLLADQIMAESAKLKTDQAQPVATTLDADVLRQLQAGRNLDPEEQAALAGVQRERGALGDVSTENIGETMTTGTAGENRLLGRENLATQWLASGATPEDVNYRRRQQAMSNMANFLRGQTPQSQFASLSGAQQGATPAVTGAPLPAQNPNAGAQGMNLAANTFQARLGALQNQSSWWAGINTALQGVQTYAAATR